VNKVLHGPLPKGKRSTKPWESAGNRLLLSVTPPAPRGLKQSKCSLSQHRHACLAARSSCQALAMPYVAGRGGEAFGKLHILKPKVLTAMEKEWATSCDRGSSRGSGRLEAHTESA
jgi:hypothetical protein